tara:strand:+ start:182 stop:2395 length:2214 start_codon:yes stop_codon:yes gene_type:complete
MLLRAWSKAVVALVFVAGVQFSWGALSPLGAEFPVLGNISGHQQNPHVALGRLGGFVVWQNSTESDTAERVMVQRLGNDMTGRGIAVRVSQSQDRSNELNPRVALMKSGGAAVVWVGGPRASSDIYIRFLDSSGNFLGVPTIVNSHLPGIQRAPTVAALAGGGVAVVWTSLEQDAEGEGVYAQLFTTGGFRLGGEFQVNQAESRNQSDAAVAALPDGGFVVAWVNEAVAGRTGVGAQDLQGNLVGRLYGAQGAPRGAEYQLNDGQGVGMSPALSADAEGGFTLAWSQRDSVNIRNLSDIYTRRFNSAGLPLTSNVRQNTWLRGEQVGPELVQMGGEALVAWTSYGQDTSGGGIQARLISGGREFQVNTQSRMHQRAPTVAADGAGKFLVVWVNTISATHSILSGQRYVSSDGELAGVVDVTAGEVELVEAVAQRQKVTPVSMSAQPEPVLSSGLDVALKTTENVAPVRKNVISRAAPQVVLEAPAAPRLTPVESTVNTASAPASAPSAPSMAEMRAAQASAVPPNSAAAGRSMLLAAARMRTQDRRSMMTRSAPTLAQVRSAAPSFASIRNSYAQRLANARATAPRPLGASRQFAGTGYQRTSGWRNGTAGAPSGFTRATQMAGTSSAASRGFNSASSRFNQLMGNSLSRTAMQRRAREGQGQQQVRPVATSLQRSDDGLRIQWSGRQGARYQVQGSSDLRQWQNVGAARAGNGRADSVSVNSGGDGPRYYRVVRVN